MVRFVANAMPPFDEIALKPVHEILALMASAKKKMSNYDYVVVNSSLWKLGAMAA